MKTRILALLLVLVLALSALVACGPTNPPEPEDCVKCVDNDNDKKCDVCKKPIKTPDPVDPDNPEVEEIPDVTWNETVSLNYFLTENSNNGELSSGCRHYMAGDTAKVDDPGNIFYTTIQERNANAESYAHVSVAYDYGTINAGWGSNIKTITGLCTQGSANGRPDIVVNFVYDMMSASLNKAFQNVYSQTGTSECIKQGELNNYFAFATEGAYNPDYLDMDNGYMVEYMQSLSLSRDRMYFVASDYFIDLVRAFFVIPVNITMLEAIGADADNKYITDEDRADGKYSIDEFYAMVNRNEWTYEAMAAFSANVYSPGETTDPLDGIRGFAVSTNGGLGASGLLYTTSITIIEREWDEYYIENDDGTYTGDFRYWYPDAESTNAKRLGDFVEQLSWLFGADNPGVVTVGSSGATDQTSFANGNAIAAILERFSENKLLFGGIICVGALEDPGYTEMVEDKGNQFGVVPVPLYRNEYVDVETGATMKDKYLTQVHSLGKVAGIAFMSQKFAAASAYLNWLSLNSSDILDDYYKYTLTAEAAGGGEIEGTADMLAYIRANVRTSFDKAFEDAIAKFYQQGGDADVNSNKWHNIILSHKFILERDDIVGQYSALVDTKNQCLETVEKSYENLPF